MNEKSALNVFIDILLNRTFRWVLMLIIIILTVMSYIQEPIRFSKMKSPFGVNYKLHYFILICITMFLYIFNFLGLEFTIPFSKNLVNYWYIPVIILIYAILLDITLSSKPILNDKGNLEPPPSYLLPKKYRLIIFYFILIIDVIIFIQGLLYSGITINFQTTVLHQYFLNRFGGFKPGNMLMFVVSWLGIVGLGLDMYMLRNQLAFNACSYGLPESWNF